jgi:FSR family fosmidomycin resistance protein-like MFS transporter
MDMNQPEKPQRAGSLFSFSSFHFLDDGFADSIYLLLPFIAAELHLSFSQVGLLKGVFSGAMSLFQLPMSLLGEKVGELTVIAGGNFGLTGGFFLLSLAYSFPAILFCLIFSKAAAGGQHALGSSTLSKVFESSGRRAAMGTYNFAGDIGKVCIPFLVATAINFWGWRQGIFVLSIAGMAAGCVLWILTAKISTAPPLPKRIVKSVQKDSRWGIQNWKSFSALLTIGILDLSVRNVLLTFLPFLLLMKGIPESQFGYALTLLFAGGAGGKFVCGILAERFGIVSMVISTEALTAVGILALLWTSPTLMLILLPLVGIVLNGTSSVLYATVAEIISPGGRSRGYGMYYAITQSFGALSPIIYGLVTDSLGLSFTLLATTLMALVTIPLSKFLVIKPKKL